MNAISIIYVFIGGGLGSMLRFLISSLIQKTAMFHFPLGTMLVNILGCVVMGYLFATFAASSKQQEVYKLVLMVGFCGGFTTFSSFALEQMNLINQQQWVAAVAYLVGTNIACLFAVMMGGWMYRFASV